jgi:hypothetical protein
MSWRRRTFVGALAGAALAACAKGNVSNSPPDEQLNAFMKLSETLTGFGDLDPAIGATYLKNLRGQMEDRQAEILAMWYSGTYVGANGRTTVTWTQALAWRACTFTKPPSLCAVPGSWAKPPA